MDFCIYYLKKAGSLLNKECKVPLFTFLKFYKIITIIAIFINGVLSLFILFNSKEHIYMCHHIYLWLNPIFTLLMVFTNLCVFRWLKSNTKKQLWITHEQKFQLKGIERTFKKIFKVIFAEMFSGVFMLMSFTVSLTLDGDNKCH